jgi:hypothetical protein
LCSRVWVHQTNWHVHKLTFEHTKYGIINFIELLLNKQE